MTLSVENLTRVHPGGRGVTGVSFEARPGETIALIGPSGCGKTTLLRTLAGLAEPDSGRVLLDGQDITRLAPERRNIGLIFQNYALFPHLSVFDNVAYGLRARGRPRNEIAGAVARALELVDLSGRGGRIDQLSGGEQQRVAVARAVVPSPRALLLDEPLSNLDPNLRQRMREGLKEILQRLAIPAIHVTHDQEEALSIADRVAVLEAGRLVQIGAPEVVFGRPSTPFVARFVGAANVLAARVVAASGDRVTVTILGGVSIGASSDRPLLEGAAVDVVLRPHAIDVLPKGDPRGFDAVVTSREFLGHFVELRCQAGAEMLVVRVPSHLAGANAETGVHVSLLADPAFVHVMPR